MATATFRRVCFPREQRHGRHDNAKMATMKVKTICAMALVLGALTGPAGCNVISFFPHKAAEVAADKVIDDTLPRDPASVPPQQAVNAAAPAAARK